MPPFWARDQILDKVWTSRTPYVVLARSNDGRPWGTNSQMAIVSTTSPPKVCVFVPHYWGEGGGRKNSKIYEIFYANSFSITELFNNFQLLNLNGWWNFCICIVLISKYFLNWEILIKHSCASIINKRVLKYLVLLPLLYHHFFSLIMR